MECPLCADGWPVHNGLHELPEPAGMVKCYAPQSAGAFKCAAKLVIIESPYAGDIEENTAYARKAMRDSLERGEYPIASHLLYTQPGILDEHNPVEREWGIRAGLAWRDVAEKAVFYVDRGISGGMEEAKAIYEKEGFPFETRRIDATP